MLGRSIRAVLALCLVFSQIAYAEVGGNWMGGGRNSLLYGYAQPVPASGCFPGTSVVLDIDPSNLSTLFQTIAGTTAVTTDGDVVGTAKDANGNGFDLTAVADTSVRVVYNTSGGLHWLTFDGTDVLKRGAYLGLWGTAHTIAVALRHDAAAQGSVLSEKNVADAEVEYRPLRNHASDFNDIQAWKRIDDGTYRLNNVTVGDEGFTTTTDVSIIITDTGTLITAYQDGSNIGNSGTYTAASGTAPDVFSIGGTYRTTASDFFAGRIYRLRIWSRVLDAGEIATTDTCLKATQGR